MAFAKSTLVLVATTLLKPEACQLALSYYRDMQAYCDNQQPELVAERIRTYGRDSGAIWFMHRDEIMRYMHEEEQ